MLNSSLIKILRTFTQDELKKFNDFINSPYHNKKTGAVQLFKGIVKYEPEFKNKELDRKELWKEVFPGKDFNYGIMKNLIYDLTRLAENFLIYEEIAPDEFLKTDKLITTLLEKDLKELFTAKFKNIEKNILKESFLKNIKREDYYYYLWRYYHSKGSFENRLIHSNNFDNILNLISDYFLANFFIHAFKIFHNIKAITIGQNFIPEKNTTMIFLRKVHEANLIEEIIKSVKPISVNVSNVLNVYYKMFLCMLKNDSVENYFDFKKTLQDNLEIFSKRDLYSLYTTLINCIIYLDTGKIEKYEERLNIYDLMIEKNLFSLENDVFWDQNFLSYISAACDFERIDSIEKFIKKFINRLQKKTRENMLLFANAHLYFGKDEFGKSLETIAKTDYDLFQMKYFIRNLQIKNYYELNDYNSFQMTVDSYNHFINKNKNVSDKWRKQIKSFCVNVNRLFKLKESFDEFEFKNLKKKFNAESINNKTWLGRKIEEFEILNSK